jgi:hypothetical protein
MVLAGHGRERVGVAAAVGHDDENGVVAIFLVGFDGGDELAQAFVDDGDAARVVGHVSPVDVIGVIVIDHDQFGAAVP